MKRASYREALEKYGEFVRLSKQLATIPTDAPVPLSLEALKIRQPDPGPLRELYAELGFTSLLRELAPLADDQRQTTRRLIRPPPFRNSAIQFRAAMKLPLWLSLDSEDPDEEGFGARVLGVEVSTKAGHGALRCKLTWKTGRSPR